jgi:hypothetical protein
MTTTGRMPTGSRGRSRYNFDLVDSLPRLRSLLLLTVHFSPSYDIPYLQSNVDCLVVSEHRLQVQVVWPPMYKTLPPRLVQYSRTVPTLRAFSSLRSMSVR